MLKLSSSDLEILGNYHFVSDEFSKSKGNRFENSTLLCVKNNELGTVKREDVTCWEIFKSYFGCGKLAGCELRLTSISRYLEGRDLSEVSPDHSAYQTIHAIAARMLIYKKSGSNVPQLWCMLSHNAHTLQVEFYKKKWRYGHETFCGSRLIYPSVHYLERRQREFLMTPLSTVGHMTAQAELEKRKFCWKNTPIQASAIKQEEARPPQRRFLDDGRDSNHGPRYWLLDPSSPINDHLLNTVRFRACVREEDPTWAT